MGSAIAANAGATVSKLRGKKASSPTAAIANQKAGPKRAQHRPAYTMMPTKLKATLTVYAVKGGNASRHSPSFSHKQVKSATVNTKIPRMKPAPLSISNNGLLKAKVPIRY